MGSPNVSPGAALAHAKAILASASSTPATEPAPQAPTPAAAPPAPPDPVEPEPQLEPQQAATPEPPIEPEPTESPSEPAESPSEPAATSLALDLSALSPEYVSYLKSKGLKEDGSNAAQLIQYLAQRNIEIDNRRAAEARGETPPEPETTPEPTPAAQSVQLDPQEIEGHVSTAMAQDRAAQQFIADWRSSRNSLVTQLGTAEVTRLLGARAVEGLTPSEGEIPKLNARIQYLRQRAEESDIKDDEFKAKEVSSELSSLEQRLTLKQLEARDLRRELADFDRSYQERQEAYRQHITKQLQEQRGTAQRQSTDDNRVSTEARELETAWTSSLTRVAKELGLKPEGLDRHARRAVTQLSLMNPPRFLRPYEAESFLRDSAKEYKAELDEYHRAQAALYAKQRAVQPTIPSPAPVATPASTKPVPFKQNLSAVRQLLHQRARTG